MWPACGRPSPMLTETVPVSAAPAAVLYAVLRDGLGALAGCTRLREALGAALGEPVALIYAQPHDLTLVADGLGPAAVQTLLDHMGRRLAGIAGASATVGRTSDDGFVLIVRDLGS